MSIFDVDIGESDFTIGKLDEMVFWELGCCFFSWGRELVLFFSFSKFSEPMISIFMNMS